MNNNYEDIKFILNFTIYIELSLSLFRELAWFYLNSCGYNSDFRNY